KLTKALDKVRGVAALELNISCPNVQGKERLVSQDEEATYQLVKSVRGATKKTVITKLSPNVTDIVAIGRAAQDAGSDAISLVNTFVGMSIDIDTKAPKLGNVTGGLSGPAIKPIALRIVWQVAQEIKIPIIGMGGIMDASDAIEFIIAGASAVCVGTANLADPSASLKIIQGIDDYLDKNKIKDIKKLIGCLKINQ
ncbi:MAG: tRNA-dihydrouridine synthase, partial [Candidatus Omnitrophica bacterium]|nr:tRNA-dihydrouridine synthase [Candidatus Omnitrophota bacterium]